MKHHLSPQFQSHARSRLAGAIASAFCLLSLAQSASAETWTLTSRNSFYLQSPPLSFTGYYFSQGLAFNSSANEWISSWQYGLQRTDLAFNSLQRLGRVDVSVPNYIVPGIPAPLLAQGLDHIGDIDIYNGKVYVSLDTTSNDPLLGYNYGHGHVAVFNASDLSYTGQSYELLGSPANLHRDVASWVAVNGAAGVGYGKEWQDGNTINIYNLSDWSFSSTLTMDRTLGRIQGAKVFNGWLYMSSDNSTASVYRTDLSTGHVEELFQLPSTPGSHEVEGIAVRELPGGGVELVVEVIVNPDSSSSLTNPNIHVDLLHYTLAPVPEPATPALMFGGLVALGTLLRRSRRRG